MRDLTRLAPCILIAILGGCVSLPKFSGSPLMRGSDNDRVPKVDTIVQHIQCELVNAVNTPEMAKVIDDRRFAVAVQLTIEVTDDGSFNPSLSFVHALSAADTKRVVGVSGGYDGSAHRTYTESFTLVLDKKRTETHKESCVPSLAQETSGLSGDLGILQVLRQGLVQTATSPKSSNNSSGSSSRYFIPVDDTGDPKSAESFGSTIDFTIVYGGGVDPVWTLTNFGGPGGGSPSFVHYARTSKDTMVISFSEVKRSKPQNSQIIPQNQQYFTKTLDDDAVERANKQLDRQILQSNLRNK